jgi:hypothetical protein
VLPRKLPGAAPCLRYPLAPLISALIQRCSVFGGGSANRVMRNATRSKQLQASQGNGGSHRQYTMQASRAVADAPESSPRDRFADNWPILLFNKI